MTVLVTVFEQDVAPLLSNFCSKSTRFMDCNVPVMQNFMPVNGFAAVAADGDVDNRDEDDEEEDDEDDDDDVDVFFFLHGGGAPECPGAGVSRGRALRFVPTDAELRRDVAGRRLRSISSSIIMTPRAFALSIFTVDFVTSPRRRCVVTFVILFEITAPAPRRSLVICALVVPDGRLPDMQTVIPANGDVDNRDEDDEEEDDEDDDDDVDVFFFLHGGGAPECPGAGVSRGRALRFVPTDAELRRDVAGRRLRSISSSIIMTPRAFALSIFTVDFVTSPRRRCVVTFVTLFEITAPASRRSLVICALVVPDGRLPDMQTVIPANGVVICSEQCGE